MTIGAQLQHIASNQEINQGVIEENLITHVEEHNEVDAESVAPPSITDQGASSTKKISAS